VIGEFAGLLAPTGLDAFFADYWNRRPFRAAGDPNRLAGLFSQAEFDRLLSHCEQLKAGFYDRKGWFCDFPINPGQVKRLLEAQMTICAGVLPAEGALGEFLALYRRGVTFAGVVYLNAYLSPDGQGFGLHLDDHPVWILQIDGSKRWSVSPEIGVPEPVRGFSFPPDRTVLNVPWGRFERPDESRFFEVTLEPGDVLYLPAGTWHKARAIGHSLALTMASRAATGLDLARAAILDRLDRYPALLRRDWGIDTRATAAGGVPDALRPGLDETAAALRDWAATLDTETLYRLWRTTKA
jgi:hypothetical protein